MGKKAIIEISLVEECNEKANNEIAGEIFKDLSEGETVIPWCKQINKVLVVDADRQFASTQ
jgi:hypothetical protein